MEQHNFKKQFGQNFLKEDYFAKILVETAELTEDDIVIEIGAGHGIVTKEIAKIAKLVYALDIDTEITTFLNKKFKNNENIKILNRDILTWEFLDEVKDQSYKVISSLPYNVAKKILKIFLTNNNPPKKISVLIQKEVADKYLAKAPKASFLSNFANIYSDVEYIADVPHDAFFPEPKVESTIIAFTNHEIISDDPKALISFIKSGYSNPRKMLVNNLANYLHLPKETIQAVMKKTKLPINLRPENLKLADWQELFKELSK